MKNSGPPFSLALKLLQVSETFIHSFQFILDLKAANHNAKLFACHDYDFLQSLTADGPSPLPYGSELWKPYDINKWLLGLQPFCPHTKEIPKGSIFQALDVTG
jgi:hypothetical protein